jgi:hypothetical protein
MEMIYVVMIKNGQLERMVGEGRKKETVISYFITYLNNFISTSEHDTES